MATPNTYSFSSIDTLIALYPRAVDVTTRHGEADPNLLVHRDRLVVLGDGLVAADTRSKAHAHATRLAVRAANAAMNVLESDTRMWLDFAETDIEGFDSASYRAELELPEMIIGTAESLLERIAALHEISPIWFVDRMLAALPDRIDAAKTTRATAQRHLGEQRDLRATLADAAQSFHDRLVRLRRYLRRTLGSTHRDYRLLKTDRGGGGSATQNDVGEAALAQVATLDPLEQELLASMASDDVAEPAPPGLEADETEAA